MAVSDLLKNRDNHLLHDKTLNDAPKSTESSLKSTYTPLEPHDRIIVVLVEI